MHLNKSWYTLFQWVHFAPNPKKIIQINGSGKRGRYVRIQLLDKNYLSLAEVQVIGHDATIHWRLLVLLWEQDQIFLIYEFLH
jgi:hypothetical protein